MTSETIKGYKGATLETAQIEDDGGILRLCFQNREPLVFRAYGDCCSTSWVEHLEVPTDLRGAVFMGERKDSDEVPPWDGHECGPRRGWKEQSESGDYREHVSCDHEYLQVYSTRFPTSRGDIVVEYRNDSNGYYGGWLALDGNRWGD